MSQECVEPKRMFLEIFYQFLATIGISTSQEEEILTAIRNLSISRKVLQEHKFHEPHLQQGYLEPLFDHPCQFSKETKALWITFNREQSLELDTKGFLTCLSSNHVPIQETNQPPI